MADPRVSDQILLVSGPSILLGGLIGHYVRQGVDVPEGPIFLVLWLGFALYFTVRPGQAFSSKFSIYLLGAFLCLMSVFTMTGIDLGNASLLWINCVFVFLSSLSSFQEAKILGAFTARQNILFWALVFVGLCFIAFMIEPPLTAIIGGALVTISSRYASDDGTDFKSWIKSIGDKLKKRDFFLDNGAIAFWTGLAFIPLSYFVEAESFRWFAGLVVCIAMMQIFDRRWPFAILSSCLLIFYAVPLPTPG